MPATQIYVKSKGELMDNLQTAFGNGKKVVVLCEGTTSPSTGDSWNDECRKVEPLLEPLLASANENVYFFMVEVGSEDEWKNATNPFKSDNLFSLQRLPTLLHLDSPTSVKSRLEGEACLKPDALAAYFL